ncbi:MAG: glycosyltransferase family 39 protein [Nanoarchaeota archaeon]|nr:glycosyltransferase family 39 protein [Nanoarchaeota archaeon]
MEENSKLNYNEIIKKRKEAVVNWFKKDKLNIALIGILLFALVIRLYYFFTIGNQPLWWDELCYGSLAKNFVSHMWDGDPLIIGESLIRPLFFPILWAILLKLGFQERGARFLLELVPSIFSVFFIYLSGKELFGKRVGLISAAIFSVFWLHLFYSVRLLTNVPALVFLFASFYFFVKSTKKEFNYKEFSISLILLSISTLIRYPNGILFFVYLIVLIIGKKLFLKKKNFWIAGIIGISPILLFFLFNFFTYGNIFPALLGGNYLSPKQTVEGIAKPFAFNLLNFIPIYLQTTFFIFFLIGLALMIFELIIAYNFIPKKIKLQRYMLLILSLIFIYSFFIFYLKAAEDRWLFASCLPLILIVSYGLDFLYLQIKKYNKLVAIILLIGVIAFGAYGQFQQANQLIDNKKTSYSQMKEGFLWVDENTPKDSVIVGKGIEPYTVYYSERQYHLLGSNENSSSLLNDSDYLIYHNFIGQPEWLTNYLQSNQITWKPVNGYFFDKEQKQLAMIIYER